LRSSSGSGTQYPEETPRQYPAGLICSKPSQLLSLSGLLQLLSAIHMAHSLREQISRSSDYMHFESPTSDKPGKAELFWIHSSKEKKKKKIRQ